MVARHLDQLGIGVAIPRLGGIGHARCDGIDADVVRGELERHGASHRDHPALARAVVHATYGTADRLRGDVDHRAGGLTGRHERLDEGDRGKAASFEVDIEHVVPVALAHLKQLHPRVNAGVVDQYVGRPQHAGGIRHHHVDVGKPRDIGADEMDAATDLADARCHPSAAGSSSSHVIATSAPSSASATAMAAPIPCCAPVTSAILPANFMNFSRNHHQATHRI